jgi:hypothetical protein
LREVLTTSGWWLEAEGDAASVMAVINMTVTEAAVVRCRGLRLRGGASGLPVEAEAEAEVAPCKSRMMG